MNSTDHEVSRLGEAVALKTLRLLDARLDEQLAAAERRRARRGRIERLVSSIPASVKTFVTSVAVSVPLFVAAGKSGDLLGRLLQAALH
ncbi:hypothetical protein [Paraburkholderia sp. Cpub6]|uniref:hypothetical protein n=1 Tax=Paraburkholderia sp. Cpub6 TaxID=2723094 RepID=UPI0016132E70|nr:hypothetical protein [Paraburkholderia sp. Cpub6]MBB5456681.1 hypothetical protein [Paraburkholderia sp. Cpub6]